MSSSADSHAELDPRRSPPSDDFTVGMRSGLRGALRSGWIFIVVLPLLCAAAAYALSVRAPVQYEASARVFLDGSTLSANGADPVRQVLTQSKLVVSAETIAQVSRKLRLPEGTAEASLSAEAAPNGDFFTVSGRGATPADAVALVTAAEQAYQSVAGQQRQRGGTKLLDQLVSQRAAAQAAYDDAQVALKAEPGNLRLQARVAVLAAQLRALSSEETAAFTVQPGNGDPVLLAEQAQLPTSPSTPMPKRDSLLGGVFGFLLAAVALWWRSSRLRTIAGTDVYLATGVVRLAELPRRARSWWKRRPNDQVARDGTFVEAALALDLAMPNDVRVLLLAPCRRGDVAPEVAAGLAGALARDRSVVLVDCDPGDRALTDGLQRLGVGQLEPSNRLVSGPAHDVLGGASFVRAQEPSGPATRHYYSHLIADLGTATDLVVLVGAPPDASLPAALLAASSDAAVIVARSDTPLSRVVTTRDRLTSLGPPTLGLLLDQAIDANGWRRVLRRSPNAPRSRVTENGLGPATGQTPHSPSSQPATDGPRPRPSPYPTEGSSD